MSKKVVNALLGFLCFGLVIIPMFGCSAVNNLLNPTAQNYGTMVGYIYDTSGSALGSVTITAVGTGKTATTNSQGWFALSSLEANSALVVTLTKTGYVSSSRTVSIVIGRQTYLAASLLTASGSGTTFANTAGGTVTVGTTSAVFPANAFIDANGTQVTGNVTVTITRGTFTTTNDADAFPGQFQGVDATGATVSFESFGWLNISATDASGNAVNVASTATWTLNVSNETSVTPPTNSVPLWYFSNNQWNAVVTPNTSTQINATYSSTTNSFTASITGGTVSNTPWNIDRPWGSSVAYIKGKVVDAAGNAVAAANIKIRAIEKNWLVNATTGSDGSWGPVVIPASRACTVIAQKGSKSSTAESVAALSATTYTSANPYTVANIVLDSPKLLITLDWGANPRDLDSHLTFPKETSSSTYRYHLYYYNRSATSSTAYPYANLDTDDTDGYGPEHTTVYRVQEGTYRFCVHHYAGSSSIENSGAVVTLNVDDGQSSPATYRFTPPANQDSTKLVWQVFDASINSSGQATITTLGTYGAPSKATYDPNSEADTLYTTSVNSLTVGPKMVK